MGVSVSHLRFSCHILALLVGASELIHAQDSYGSITGIVTDPSKSPVAGASVNAISLDTNVSTRAVTSSDGLFNVISLVPGEYRLEVVRQGFDTSVTLGVIVSAGSATTVNPQLQVGAVSTRIEVTATAVMLTATTPDVSTTIDRSLAANLPLTERNAMEAAMLVPGVRGDPNSPGQVVAENAGIYIGNISPGAATNIAGGMPGSTAIMIDGSNVTQASIGRTAASVSGEMIQEVTVITNGVPAKYGNTGGGVVIQATRSGTNDYHGSFNWRHTDPAFNAQPVGQTIPNAVHQNYLGAYLGGPVVLPKLYNGRNRTFVFGGFEPARLFNATTVLGTIPTPAELAGNFADSISLLNTTILAQQGLAAALAAPRTGGLYYQSPVNAAGFPTGARYLSTAQYLPIPNNSVAAQLAQNKFAQFVLSQYPTPQNPGPYVQFLRPDGLYNNNGYNASLTRAVKNSDDRYSFRIDHTFDDKDRMYVRYSRQPLTATRAYGFPITSPLTGFPTDNASAYVVSLSETHLLTSSMVSELKVMFARNHQVRGEPPAALTQDFAAAYGLTPAVLGVGVPSISFSNYSLSIGTNQLNSQVDSNYQISDSISWTKGRHTIDFGFDLRRQFSNQYNPLGSYGGNYGFSPNATNNGSGGNAYASFILGLVNSYTNTPLQVPAYYRWNFFGGYLQDDVRLTGRLTLNLGLRYEFQTPRMEKNDNQGTFIPSIAGTLNGMPAKGAFCFHNNCGLGHTLWPANYKGFEPRVGIAWAPAKRITVRANYGLMRVPLTGYGNIPLPNFNVNSFSVGGTTGGVTPNVPVDYLTNPIAQPLSSAYTALAGRGPFFTVQGVTVPYIAQKTTVPYIQQWGVTIQTMLDSKTLLQLGYAGTVGVHLISTASPPLNFPDLSRLFGLIQSGANFSATNLPNPFGIVQNGAVINENLLSSLNPYQNFFNQPLQEQFYRGGNSNYHALLIGATRRLSHGLSLQTSFTWSKSIDDAGGSPAVALGGSIYGNATVQNPFNLRLERAVSNFDTPARFTMGYSYAPPTGKGRLLDAHNRLLNNMIGGWNTSGILNVQSGMPFLVQAGNSGYWVSSAGTSVLPAGILLRPNLVPGQGCMNSAFSYSSVFSVPFINPNAVAVPGTLLHPAFGDAPRTLTGCRSPAMVSLNGSIQKKVFLGASERRYLQVQLDALNALNHTLYFYNPNSGMKAFNNFNSASLTNASVPAFTMQSNFGVLSQANSAILSRTALVSVKLVW